MDTSGVQIAEGKDSGSSVPRRRYRTVGVKRRIVEETFRPGASVAVVARRHGVNANQVFAWRKQYRRGALNAAEERSDRVTLLPIEVSCPSSAPAGLLPPAQTPPAERIEIELGSGRRLSVHGRVDLEMLCALIRELSQP